MTRRQIRKDMHGKGWKHTKSHQAGKDGHIVKTPLPEPEVERELDPIEIEQEIERLSSEITEIPELVEETDPEVEVELDFEPESEDEEIERLSSMMTEVPEPEPVSEEPKKKKRGRPRKNSKKSS